MDDLYDEIYKTVEKRLKDEHKTCLNCEFNFPYEDGTICAAHDSLWGYGGKIKSLDETCSEWGISLEFFSSLADYVVKDCS